MSEVGDLSFVVDDGVLSDSFEIKRSTGSFQLGGWVTSSVTIPGYGVVSVASEEDLEMVPEGDRITGAMVFHSGERIYLTQEDNTSNGPEQRVSDIIIWTSQQWRVMHVSPYSNFTYWKAIAVRMKGH